MKVRRFVYSVASALALAALWPSFPLSRGNTRPDGHTRCTTALRRARWSKVVREVTERFRDVGVAEAEDYPLSFGCVSGEDSGAMGLHYANIPLSLMACWIRRVPRS